MSARVMTRSVLCDSSLWSSFTCSIFKHMELLYYLCLAAPPPPPGQALQAAFSSFQHIKNQLSVPILSLLVGHDVDKIQHSFLVALCNCTAIVYTVH
jgi:hypothetical protein